MHTISIRLNDEEKRLLDERIQQSGLTLSNYVRKKLFESHETDTHSHQAMQILHNMLTDINKLKTFKDKQYIDSIEKGAAELWRILL